MNAKNELENLTREELLELIKINAKNLLVMDGVWFQSIEKAEGMDAAMFHDGKAWEIYTVAEAKRIKALLKLPDRAGLEGLERALSLRFSAILNEPAAEYADGKLIYTLKKCRVQTARERKGMPYHPCKPVGLIEYSGFAKTIDDRISCRCLSCFPDVADNTCSCKWEFTINEEKED